MSILRFAATAALVLCASGVVAQSDDALPDGPGVDLVYGKCQQCHPISYTTESAGLPDFLWQDTLGLMKQLGMQVTDQEEQQLFEYLTTYLGTSPPPEPAEAADDKTVASAAEADGAAVYARSCVACHGADGAGVAGTFPPLVPHAATLAKADRNYLPLVVLYGLAGEIEVNGKTYGGVMPGWAHLSNAEIAAVLNLVTVEWNATESETTSGFESYSADEIETARSLGLSGAEVYTRRPVLP